MAEEQTPIEEGTDGTTQAASAEQPGQQERTFTQEEVNRLVGDARKKVRSQYQGYDELKAQAEARADYDDVKAELEALKAERARAEVVARVAAEAKLPQQVVSMLSGATEEELATQAAALRSAMPAYPVVHDDGEPGKAAVTAEDIRNIRDPRERIRARAAHPELFE